MEGAVVEVEALPVLLDTIMEGPVMGIAMGIGVAPPVAIVKWDGLQEAYSAASFAAYSILSYARMEHLMGAVRRKADALITRILRRQMT